MREFTPRVDHEGYPVNYIEDAAYVGHMAGLGILQLGNQRLLEATRRPTADDDVPAAIELLENTLQGASRFQDSIPVGIALGQCEAPKLDIFLAGIDPGRTDKSKAALADIQPFIDFTITDQSTEVQRRKNACLSTGPFCPIVDIPAWFAYRATDRHGKTFEDDAAGDAAAILLHEHTHNTTPGLMVLRSGLVAVNHVPWRFVGEHRQLSDAEAVDNWPQQYPEEKWRLIVNGDRRLFVNRALAAVHDRAKALAQRGQVMFGKK